MCTSPEEKAVNRSEQLISMETTDKNSGTLCREKAGEGGSNEGSGTSERPNGPRQCSWVSGGELRDNNGDCHIIAIMPTGNTAKFWDEHDEWRVCDVLPRMSSPHALRPWATSQERYGTTWLRSNGLASNTASLVLAASKVCYHVRIIGFFSLTW